MMRHAILALALLWASGPVSATLISYNFNGAIDESGGCFTRPECGSYSGMITIDDAQTGTAMGSGDAYQYQYVDLMMTLADGTELSSAAGTLTARTTSAPIQEVSTSFLDSEYLFLLFWQFADATFDTSNITQILTAMTSGPLLTTTHLVAEMPITATSAECTSSGSGFCVGSLSALSEKPAAVPEPTVLALLSFGLAGLGFTRRRMKA